MEYVIPSKNALNPNKETIYITSNISEDMIWYSSYNYVLMNEIRVRNGATLRIEPGTIIYANSVELSNESSIPAIVVEQGSKLLSCGTKENPIIFTSILSLEEIFEVNKYTNKYVYCNGLGPFGEFWNGITISGTNATNTLVENNTKLGTYYIPYGGTNEESYHFELKYTYIYFAGINRFESNSLTLGAPSYQDKLCNCEILFGQTSCLVVYGGSLMVNHNIMGFTYSVGCIGLANGAQVYFVKNFFIEGLDNIDPEYLSTDSLNSIILATTVENVGDDINRRSLVFANNNTFLSLTYTTNYITLLDESRLYTVNNLYIGNCINVYNLLNVTNGAGGILTISNELPLTYSDNYIYLGPCTYSHINGVYYAGPTIDINIPNESSQTLRHIEFLFYGVDQCKLVDGKFLDVIPNIVSDVYHNSTSNNDYLNNHLVPLISNIYWNNLPDTDSYLRFKTPSYACGVIQNELDLKNWNFGFFAHLLRYPQYCPFYVPSYWCPFIAMSENTSYYNYVYSQQNNHFVNNYMHHQHQHAPCAPVCHKPAHSVASSSSSSSSSEEERKKNKKSKKSKKSKCHRKKDESSSSSSESSSSSSESSSSSSSSEEEEKKKSKKKSKEYVYYCKKCKIYCKKNYCKKCVEKKSEKSKKENSSLSILSTITKDKNLLNNGLLLSNMVLMGMSLMDD